MRQLSNWLIAKRTELTGTTQGTILTRTTEPKPAIHSLTELREALRLQYGMRWRYRQPWLLLTGDKVAIAQLVPRINEQGWLVTPDAILLSSKCSKDGQPDAAWLKQLYRLRRRRPIDAIVLVQVEQSVPSKGRRGARAIATQMAQVTEALHFSAPIYALEVGPTSSLCTGDAPIIACEIPRQGNAQAIEAVLQSLRDQLSHQSLSKLPQNGLGFYLGKLSQQLDSRGKPLADWLAGLAGGPRRQLPVRGVAFAPVFDDKGNPDAGTDLPLWQYLGEAAQRQPGAGPAGTRSRSAQGLP